MGFILTTTAAPKLERGASLLILAATSMAAGSVQLNVGIVNVSLPSIQASLGASSSTLQWIVSLYNLVFASLMLVGGLVGDRYGHRRTLLTGLVIGLFASTVSSLAPSSEILMLARAVQGLGGALVIPSSLAILTHLFREPSERARVFGIWGAFSSIGTAAAPFLGGVLTQYAGWHSVFLVIAALGAVAGALLLGSSVETPRNAARRFDVLGVILSIITLGAFIFALTSGGLEGWTSLKVLGSFALSIVAGTLFYLHETRTPAPMVDFSLFKNPTFSSANLAVAITFLTTLSLLVFWATFFQRLQGLSPSATGAIQFLFPTAFSLASPLGGVLTARYGVRLPTVLGLVIVGVSLALFTLVRQDTSSLWLGAAFALQGLGFGIGGTPVNIAAVSSVPPERSGMASSIINAMRQLGVTVGIALFGATIAVRSHPQFSAALEKLNLDPQTKQNALESFLRNGPTNALEKFGGRPVFELADGAFLSGLHLAILVAAILAFGTALVCARAMRRGV